MKNITDEMDRVFERIVTEVVFLGSFLLKLRIASSRSIPTACVDGTRMLWNPKFFERLATAHRYFVICHEILHVALGHTLWLRRLVIKLKLAGVSKAEFNRRIKAAKIAADYIVNYILVRDWKLVMPKGALFNETYGKVDLDRLYEHLVGRGLTSEEEDGEIGGLEPHKKPPKKDKKDKPETEDEQDESSDSEDDDDETEPGEDEESEESESDDEEGEDEEDEGEGEDEEDEGEDEGEEGEGEDEEDEEWGGTPGEGDEDTPDGEPGEGQDEDGDENTEDIEDWDGEDNDEDIDTNPGGPGTGDGYGTGDEEDEDRENDGWDESFDESSLEEAQREYENTLVAAEKLASKKGQGAGWMKAVVETVAKPKIDWASILQQFFTSDAKVRRSFARPNRRFSGSDVIMPSMGGSKLGTVVVAIDTSGSMFNDKTLSEVASETEAALSSVEYEQCWLLGCDTRVTAAVEYFGGDLHRILRDEVMKGGGGTSFRPVFKWLKDNGIQPDAVVYLTDLEGDFPTNAEGAEYRTLWVGCEVSPSEGGHYGESRGIREIERLGHEYVRQSDYFTARGYNG